MLGALYGYEIRFEYMVGVDAPHSILISDDLHHAIAHRMDRRANLRIKIYSMIRTAMHGMGKLTTGALRAQI